MYPKTDVVRDMATCFCYSQGSGCVSSFFSSFFIVKVYGMGIPFAFHLRHLPGQINRFNFEIPTVSDSDVYFMVINVL